MKEMCELKVALIVLVIVITNHDVIGMNEKQLQAAVKVVRNVCTTKTKATDEDIDKMHKGDWDVDHTAMCYMYCSLSMYKLMNKDNTLNYESGISQLKQLPDSYKETTRVCMDKCRYAAVTLDDKCVAAYELTKCMYVCNPEKYFLP